MTVLRRFCLGLSLLSLVSVAACAAPGGEPDGVETGEDELRTSYGNLMDTLSETDLDRWIAARSALAAGFDRICGDTICGGDFSNLATVRIACSSTTKARKLKDCTWVLGGSADAVDGRTGRIVGEARAFTCKIPVASSAKSMLDVLTAAGQDALNAPLPGTNKSFYDGLVDCFSGVVGAPPPSAPETFYSDLAQHFWNQSSDAGLAWSTTERRLAESFDDACGDSFCEGEYPDITALGFTCSVNENTKRVARCTWSFAAAEMSVDAKGAIVATTTTRRCNVEVGAQASALAAALGGADPLHATLPGRTTSVYDALIGCL